MRFALSIAAILFAAPMVVAGRTSSDTCESYTLKCSTSKTAWAGKKTQVKAALYNKKKGTTDDVDVGLHWNPADFSYVKSKFTVKGYKAQTDGDTELYYEGVAMKKYAKIQALLDVDECAGSTTTVFAWADIGDCSLKVDCPVVSLNVLLGFYLPFSLNFLLTPILY